MLLVGSVELYFTGKQLQSNKYNKVTAEFTTSEYTYWKKASEKSLVGLEARLKGLVYVLFASLELARINGIWNMSEILINI